MNHPWQQPIRPLEVNPNVAPGQWFPVLFIAPYPVDTIHVHGWQVLTYGGVHWTSQSAMLRTAD
jgi:hypothetical protein